MNRYLRTAVCLVVVCVCIFSLATPAMASSNTFRTTAGVNFRSGPSTTASVISTVNRGTNVEVLEHDPAGWSKAKINGTTGYIRSDFLMFPIGSTPATFRTTAGVNFRSGPSTDASVISTVSRGTNVDVLEHDPAGWSKAKINGSTGYIRSDFLARGIQGSQPPSNPPSGSSDPVYRTVGVVNLRAGPSTTSSVISRLAAGTAVEMLEHNPSGWSKVRVNGADGYIRSDLLTTGPVRGNVELLDWSAARNVIRTGVPIHVVDVRTGITFTIQCFSKSGHADVEPLTRADTDAIHRSRNGVWSWAARPVWVTIGDRTLAAALNGMPHAGSTIANNGMNGHLCLHFSGTVTNNKSYQQDLRNAVAEAWRAAQ